MIITEKTVYDKIEVTGAEQEMLKQLVEIAENLCKEFGGVTEEYYISGFVRELADYGCVNVEEWC